MSIDNPPGGLAANVTSSIHFKSIDEADRALRRPRKSKQAAKPLPKPREAGKRLRQLHALKREKDTQLLAARIDIVKMVAIAELMREELDAKTPGVVGEFFGAGEPQPPAAVQPAWPPRPDWEAERIEALEREQAKREREQQAEREAQLAAEVAAAEAPQALPAPKRRKWRP